jgi:hypothetical protein
MRNKIVDRNQTSNNYFLEWNWNKKLVSIKIADTLLHLVRLTILRMDPLPAHVVSTLDILDTI